MSSTFEPLGMASVPADSTLEVVALERRLVARTVAVRSVRWRIAGLLAIALLACVALFMLTRALTLLPQIEAQWRTSPAGEVELVGSHRPELLDRAGESLIALGSPQALSAVDPLLLQPSARWLVSAGEREHHRWLQALLRDAFQAPSVVLLLSRGPVELVPHPRGVAGLGGVYWLLTALALSLLVAGLSLPLSSPAPAHWMYAAMAVCQALNLVVMAVESLPGVGLPAFGPGAALPVRMGLDLATGAAAVTAVAFQPLRLPHAALLGVGVWIAAALLTGMMALGLPGDWLLSQGAAVAMTLTVITLLSRSYRRRPHPMALVLRRIGLVVLATLLLLAAALISAERQPGLRQGIVTVGTLAWYVFFASLLLLVPFLARSQQWLREFALLAGLSTVATSLDLLFATLFSLGQFSSLALALFLSLGLYAAARQRLYGHLIGERLLTTERMFDQLYRTARRVETEPHQVGVLLEKLLRELFEPLEIERLDMRPSSSSGLADGSALLVPVPQLADGAAGATSAALLLRFARRGRRLFTPEDARLTDRLVDQLRRAVAHERAVEQGRREERSRIAQDLHDDIGARLLTLMYKAPTPEVEDYLRHTLQDLKTLTRGLAASNHRLSDAATDWKSDAAMRLGAAQCELQWRFDADQEVELNVVQWSALTRLLRELLSNVISHARATQVQIELVYRDNHLMLRVSDNGTGGDPSRWSHGLGLSGVRKRVRLLDGTVDWAARPGGGITASIEVSNWGIPRR